MVVIDVADIVATAAVTDVVEGVVVLTVAGLLLVVEEA